MEVNEYLEANQKIQRKLIAYLDFDENTEEHFQNLFEIFKKYKFQEDKHEIYEFLLLLSNISCYHYRKPNFNEKIEQILNYIKPEIQKNFSNLEIYKIFVENKRILLFLLKNEMIKIDLNLANEIITSYYGRKWFYINYFFNEIRSYISDENILKMIENQNLNYSENFEEYRRIGENHEYICQLIRNDDISEFITYVNKNSISLNSTIPNSIFESNTFLLECNTASLIEYAVFFGSVQIFKYLYKNGVQLKNSIWKFAAHGDDAEIIHILEENEIKLSLCLYGNVIEYSIKCHSIDITNYILENMDEDQKNELLNEFYFLKVQKLNDYPDFELFDCYTSLPSFEYHNYLFFPAKLDNPFNFGYLCKYNYVGFVKILLQTKNILINQRII